MTQTLFCSKSSQVQNKPYCLAICVHVPVSVQRSNVQMINIWHTYKTSTQSYPLHNQPPQRYSVLFSCLTKDRLHRLRLSQYHVTLHKYHNHSNWYKTVDFSGNYHHTEFNRNQFKKHTGASSVYGLFNNSLLNEVLHLEHLSHPP